MIKFSNNMTARIPGSGAWVLSHSGAHYTKTKLPVKGLQCLVPQIPGPASVAVFSTICLRDNRLNDEAISRQPSLPSEEIVIAYLPEPPHKFTQVFYLLQPPTNELTVRSMGTLGTRVYRDRLSACGASVNILYCLPIGAPPSHPAEGRSCKEIRLRSILLILFICT
jgi:hypothetical protein